MRGEQFGNTLVIAREINNFLEGVSRVKWQYAKVSSPYSISNCEICWYDDWCKNAFEAKPNTAPLDACQSNNHLIFFVGAVLKDHNAGNHLFNRFDDFG